MKKNEEEVRNNGIADGEAVDGEITAVYKKDADVEDGNEEESEEANEEVTAKELLANLSSAVSDEGKDSINVCYPRKGINGKNLFDSYTKIVSGIIATILDMLEKFVKGGGTFDKKQAACFKKNLLYIVKMSQNISLAIISGFRFQSNLNIFQMGWNWVCSRVPWGWMHSVDEFTIFRKSTAPYNSETVNNKLDKLNNIIYDIVRIFNNAYPEFAIKITAQYEVEKFDPNEFNNFLWYFDSEADAKSKIVAFDREFYTDYAKKIDNWCFWKGIQTGSLIFGCVVVAGVGYCIYSFGWDGFVSKISEILNNKSEESTAEEKDELFNTEEVEYLY